MKLRLPMPHDTIDDALVVASCWMNDDKSSGPVFAIILVMRNTSAFYEVLEIVPNPLRISEWMVHLSHGRGANIVPAAQLYEERSGAWGEK